MSSGSGLFSRASSRRGVWHLACRSRSFFVHEGALRSDVQNVQGKKKEEWQSRPAATAPAIAGRRPHRLRPMQLENVGAGHRLGSTWACLPCAACTFRPGSCARISAFPASRAFLICGIDQAAPAFPPASAQMETDRESRDNSPLTRHSFAPSSMSGLSGRKREREEREGEKERERPPDAVCPGIVMPSSAVAFSQVATPNVTPPNFLGSDPIGRSADRNSEPLSNTKSGLWDLAVGMEEARGEEKHRGATTVGTRNGLFLTNGFSPMELVFAQIPDGLHSPSIPARYPSMFSRRLCFPLALCLGDLIFPVCVLSPLPTPRAVSFVVLLLLVASPRTERAR